MAEKQKIAILTSGGDAPGMNAAIRAVVRAALYFDMEVYGVQDGYLGLKENNIHQLTAGDVGDIIHRGGTMLGTARLPEFASDPEVRKQCYKSLQDLGIDGLVVCGGDGSYRGANLMYKESGIKVVGLPGTIDNDLAYTDYTIGFDTALNTACECINRIRETSDSHERASLITVMGRNCGDIALHTALSCGAELYMVPEIPWSIEEVAERVKWGVLRGKRSMILVFAEGAMSSLTTDLKELCAQHPQLGDIDVDEIDSHQIARIIQVLSGHETRSTVLGYLQRGGSPSAKDRILGTQLGAHAVELLHKDVSGVAVGVRGMNVMEVPFADVQKGPHAADSGIAELVDVMAVMTRA